MTLPAFLPQPSSAVAGKWTPDQLLEHDLAWLRELGLELPLQELWNAEEGGGLLAAVVMLNGCSSGFISPEGLLITNHHCAFSILQEHSTPERDLIQHGFLAKSHGEELRGTGALATVPHRFLDVTAEIEAAIPAGADDLSRFKAIDRKKKELVARCEEQPFRRCKVATYDDGVRYVLSEALEFRDVRLVYAPPRAVGEYGGEVDNWMWPRHTGDFTLLRVYAGDDNQPSEHRAENPPYRPRHPLRVARRSLRTGDFVMVAGYPGRTYRSFVAAEMAERAELYFPRRAELYRHWIDLMQSASAADAEARILLAGRVKTLLNREKNSRGQVTGLARGKLLEKKHAEERKVLQWAAERPTHQDAVDAYRELSALAEKQRRETWEQDFLLDEAERGALDLSLALRLTRWALERAKPDLERHEDYQERRRGDLLQSQERDQKRLHPPTERLLLEDQVARLAALPEAQRVPAVEKLLAGDRSPQKVRATVETLLATTKIHDLEARQAMFEESVEELAARGDALLDFALQLNRDILAREERDERHHGASSRLRPLWRRTLQAHLGRPLDPDANGTLRVSLAHVRGYHPRDAVFMEPLTRLSGMVEKHTGEYPFNVPPAILQAASTASASRWSDPQLGDVPVAFLATGDTTGGSSGSPVLNGRGELVGVNFDRVWENIANDFGYNPEIARNVSVDIRFALWMLEEIAGPESRSLLNELGLLTETPER